jgi:hypothetical protein
MGMSMVSEIQPCISLPQGRWIVEDLQAFILHGGGNHLSDLNKYVEVGPLHLAV